MLILLPLVFKAGKKKGGPGDGLTPPAGLPDAKTGAPAIPGAPGTPGAPPGAAPAKMSVMIQSPDGKVAKPKMPPTMPVSKLLEICIQKFELSGDYQLKAGDKLLAPDKTLADAGVKEGEKILVVAKDAGAPATPAKPATPAAPVTPAAPAAPPATPEKK